MYEILHNRHLGGDWGKKLIGMAGIFLEKFIRLLYPAEAFASQSAVLCFGAPRGGLLLKTYFSISKSAAGAKKYYVRNGF